MKKTNRRGAEVSFLGALIMMLVVVLAVTYFMTKQSSKGVGEIVKVQEGEKGAKGIAKSSILDAIGWGCSGNYLGVRDPSLSITNSCTPPNCEKCEDSDACIADKASAECKAIITACETYRKAVAQEYCVKKTGCDADKKCKCENGACVKA